MGSALEWLKSVDTSRKDQYLAQRNRQRQAQRSAAAAPKPKTFGNHGVNNPTKVIDRVARGVTDFENEKKRKKPEAAQT